MKTKTRIVNHCLACVLIAITFQDSLADESAPIRIVMVPKYASPFFNSSKLGCQSQAAIISKQTGRNVTCELATPVAASGDQAVDDGTVQAEFIFNKMQRGEMDAMAVAALDPVVLTPVIDKVVKAGIPVVTFDSDAPDSKRAAYVGTDNYFFGRELGKQVKQLVPNGGTYAVFYSADSLNLHQRVAGVDDELATDGMWKPVDMSPFDHKEGNDPLLGYRLAAQLPEPPMAMISVRLAFMNAEDWPLFVDEYRSLNITFVSADATAKQIDYLNTGYAHGLLGQLPYKFGSLCAATLYTLVTGGNIPGDTISTDVVSHTVVAVYKPELMVDQHLLGNLSSLGFVFFGFIAIFAGWRVKQVAGGKESLFLMVLALGTVLLGAILIPLSFDDKGRTEDLSNTSSALSCMSVPWLAFSSLSVILAALWAKIKQSSSEHHGDDLPSLTMDNLKMPLVGLLSFNVVVLVLWTAIDPVRFTREDRNETDNYGRVNATYGSCESDTAVWYLLPLAIVNGVALVWTIWHTMSHFAQVPQSVKITLATLWQGVTMGVPVLVVLQDKPRAFYVVFCVLLLVACCVMLLLAITTGTTVPVNQEGQQGKVGHGQQEQPKRATSSSP